MIYSKIYFKQRQKLPIFIIVFTLIFSTLSFFLIFSGKATPSRASKVLVNRVEITNLNPIQTTVFWQTNGKQICSLVYGESKNNLNKIVFDERDIEKEKKPYLNHYIVLKNLIPNKDYYFVIICQNQKIIKPNGDYFNFRTPNTISNLNKFAPISGKILKENLSPVSEGIVLLTISNKKIFPLSYLLKNSGEWIIPLNSFYSQDNYEEERIEENDQAVIEILTEDGKKTTIIGSLKKLSEKNQVVIAGKNYNLQEEDNVLSAIDKINQEKNVFEVIYPKQEALIPGKKPLIKGLGIPFSLVSLTIKGENRQYSANVYIDKNGFWSYIFPENLSLGKYQAIFISKNEKNQEVKIERNFTITGNDAFEGKVLGTASQESEIKPTYDLIAPSTTPTQTIYYSPKPSVSLPVSGNLEFLPIVASFSFILTGIGILIIF